ncbi:MAG: MFS transporter [Bacteroidales bacterium]|nr:MFS transporter [Bacteroidales bacterium]
MQAFKDNITPQERRTFILHLSYSFLEGIILGVLALNEFVFIKSLKGSNYQLGFLFQFSMVVFIFLVFINEFIKRSSDKKKMLIYTGLLTRGPLALMFFFPKNTVSLYSDSVYHYLFLGIFFIYYFGNTIIYPLINLFLKNQYAHEKFGKLYSYATSLNKVVMMVATFFYGLLLDLSPHAYTFVFPVVCILGIVSVFLLSRIDYLEPGYQKFKSGFRQSVKNSIATMSSILKTNKPYQHFEIGFMFYGFSFMITVTVITIFFERALHLNYSSVAFYKNAYNIIAIILLPYTGKLLGRIDPRKFAVLTFSSLLLYIFCIMLTEHISFHFILFGLEIYPMLLTGYLFYGIFAATMALLWFIGSAYFCKPEEAGDYQSVHLSLTAVRALFAPLLGVLFYELIGFTGTFSLAIVSLAISVAIMYWSYKREQMLKVADTSLTP